MSEDRQSFAAALECERVRLETEEAELRLRIAELEQEADAIRHRAALILELQVPLAGAHLGDSAMHTAAEPVPARFCVHPEPPNLVDVAIEILREHGKEPVHYRQLADWIAACGCQPGGANPAQTVVAALSKDARFVRPTKRGYYSLKEFHPRAKNVGQRRRLPTGQKAKSKRDVRSSTR